MDGDGIHLVVASGLDRFSVQKRGALVGGFRIYHSTSLRIDVTLFNCCDSLLSRVRVLSGGFDQNFCIPE